jgi:hypothetical protein
MKALRTDAIVNQICERLSQGEPLARICREDGMPGVQTVSDWTAKDDALSVRVAQARELGGDAIAMQALAIADERDEDPASRRVMVDTRLKLLACWYPKRYGNKIGVTDGDGNALPAPIINIGFIAAKPAE